MKPKKDVQPVPGPKAVTTVGRRWYVAGQRSAQDWMSDISTGFQQALEASAISPCGQIRGTNRSRGGRGRKWRGGLRGRLRLRKEFRGAGKVDWRFGLSVKDFTGPLETIFCCFLSINQS